MTSKEKQERERRSEEIRVVASDEENPRRETEVDENEEREAVFGPEQNEDMEMGREGPLRRPVPTDQPRDISPQLREGIEGLGLIDESDAETIAKYERAENDLRAS